MDLDIQSLIQRQQDVVKNVIQKNKKGLGSPTDPALSNAAQKRSDRVKFTYYFLKQNLVDGLDEVFKTAEAEHPELQGNYYIGIISGGEMRAEVLPIEQAVDAVEDMPREEAEKFMRDSKVGFFDSQNFRMKTPSEGAFRSFRDKIQSYLNENKGVMNYLKSHPEADVSLEDLKADL